MYCRFQHDVRAMDTPTEQHCAHVYVESKQSLFLAQDCRGSRDSGSSRTSTLSIMCITPFDPRGRFFFPGRLGGCRRPMPRACDDMKIPNDVSRRDRFRWLLSFFLTHSCPQPLGPIPAISARRRHGSLDIRENGSHARQQCSSIAHSHPTRLGLMSDCLPVVVHESASGTD